MNYYESREEVLELFRDSFLIVIDPVDKSRNAAAAVSRTKLSEFILAARLFLKDPSIRFFKAEVERPKLADLKRVAKDRRVLYAYFRLREEKPRDVIWGELRRSEEGIRKALEKLGFEVYRSGSWTDELRKCLLIFELNEVELPRFTLHKGPPINLENCEKFLEKWAANGIGPWIRGDRLYVLKRNKEVSASKLLRKEIAGGRVSISKDLASYLRRAYISSNLSRLMKLAGKDEELRGFLWDFLKARPNFLR